MNIQTVRTPGIHLADTTSVAGVNGVAGVVDVERLEPLDMTRLRRAKPAYTTRFIAERLTRSDSEFWLDSGADVVPRAGDVVLARVQTIGQHKRIEGPDSRRATLFEGDEILVAYGNRYAPDQFESRVPVDLGPTNLAAAGGVAGDVVSSHLAMEDPTEIVPIGVLVDAVGVVSLQRYAPFTLMSADAADVQPRIGMPPVIAVLGTSMNSGKTTTVAAIVRGLSAAGLDVAAGKVTGTGAGGDPRLFEDSGAAAVVDFTHFGFASTYCLSRGEIRDLFVSMVRELSATKPDVIVLEIADGLFQQETARLVADPLFAKVVDKVVFAAGEALGAVGGHHLLARRGVVPVAMSGRLTASPLATMETVAALDAPVLDIAELASPDVAGLLMPLRFGPTTSRGFVRDRAG